MCSVHSPGARRALAGRSRDELREEESKFKELADTIREVFWVSDAHCHVIRYISPAYEQAWGRPCRDV